MTGMMTGGYSYKSEAAVYYAKDKGPLKLINYDNLLNDLQDNKKALSTLEGYQTYKWVKIGTIVTGLGLIAAAFSGIDKETGLSGSGKSMLITGGVVANLSWIFSFLQENSIPNAIDVYNAK